VLIFLEITEFPFNTVYGRVERSSHAKNQLDSFICFDRTPTCDGQTVDTDTGPLIVPHRDSIADSIAR